MAAVTNVATATMDKPARRTQGRNANTYPASGAASGVSVGSGVICVGLALDLPYRGEQRFRPVCHSHCRAVHRAAIMPVHKLDGTGRRILVIDDDLAIRVLLQAVLKRMKFEVELAEDGAAGLEKVRGNGGFDLILLDLMMPRLNGYEFIEKMSQSFPEDRPHIVVFTAAGKRGVEK